MNDRNYKYCIIEKPEKPKFMDKLIKKNNEKLPDILNAIIVPEKEYKNNLSSYQVKEINDNYNINFNPVNEKLNNNYLVKEAYISDEDHIYLKYQNLIANNLNQTNSSSNMGWRNRLLFLNSTHH